MCGIAGIQYKHEVDSAVLDHAVHHFGASLQHRGPDAFGYHRTPRAVYANLRLAIVDREGGRQPIFDATGQRGIVYNGEVYNHAELRSTLQAGHTFHTHADTEVVLAAVLAQGSAGLTTLNGMFGLCVWDDRDHSFLLARDRFGMKPLYVFEDEHCIAFASELRTLLGLPGLSHELDPVGFQDLLAYRYNLAPHTLFRHIRKLPAGHLLRFDGQRSQLESYAQLSITPQDTGHSEGELLEQLDGLLTDAVRSQLMGEVPIGLLLSGGLDSSAIAAYVHRAGARLKAYSIGFPEVNEFVYSRAVAQRFDLDYTEVTLTQDELRAGMDGVLRQLDEPIADPACFALSRLCADIQRDVTVVLSGEGGDELFAGYGHHQLALQPGLQGDAAFAHFFNRSASNLEANDWLRNKALPLQHLRWRGSFDNAPSLLAGMQQFELHTWLPENLMMKADKVLMAHSLEGRFPLLDLPLFNFAASLPQAMKLPHADSSKHLLRQLLKRQLPASVVDRRKMGFTVPPAFFLQTMQARLREAIATLRHTPVADVLDLDSIAALFDRLYRGEPLPVFKAWNLAVLLLWWTDVYPVAARGTPAVAAPPQAASTKPTGLPTGLPTEQHTKQRTRLVIYTALVGAKESLANPLELLPPGASSDLALDFVCITDQPQLSSPVWRMQLIGDRHLPPEKLSRRPKALPHLYFADAEHSLYIDNTVRFSRLPQAADLVTSQSYLFRAFRHATRKHPGEEAAAVAMLAYDEVDTVCGQMDFYAARRPLASLGPLTTGTVLLRQHHAPAVQRFGVLWWESILAFSKRDQLSIDFALAESGCEVDYWPGSTRNNDLLTWNGSMAARRVKASFDAGRYAWLNRSDPAALADPRAHFLAHAQAESGSDQAFQRHPRLLEYACHELGSSLGGRVAPRRQVADVLQAQLEPWRREGVNFLMLRVQGSSAARAFDSGELDAAANAIAMVMQPAEGAVMDLRPVDLMPDGRVFGPQPMLYDLLVVLGANAEQLAVLPLKLRRLVSPQAGALLAVLSSPAPLGLVVQAEQWLAVQFQASVQASTHGSRHDGDSTLLPNTVLVFQWSGDRAAAVPATQNAGATASSASPAAHEVNA
jgi:asparagine synthase (glutamine-hydrolysing)